MDSFLPSLVKQTKLNEVDKGYFVRLILCEWISLFQTQPQQKVVDILRERILAQMVLWQEPIIYINYENHIFLFSKIIIVSIF